MHVVLYKHVAHAPPRDLSYRPLVQAFVHPLHFARNIVYADMAPFADVVVSVRTYLACVQNAQLSARAACTFYLFKRPLCASVLHCRTSPALLHLICTSHLSAGACRQRHRSG